MDSSTVSDSNAESAAAATTNQAEKDAGKNVNEGDEGEEAEAGEELEVFKEVTGEVLVFKRTAAQALEIKLMTKQTGLLSGKPRFL